MLIVLAVSPVAAPSEAVGFEEFHAEVGGGQFEGKGFRAVGIVSSRSGIDARSASRDMRIVERVDVDGEPLSVFREFAASRHAAEVEARRVVRLHGERVVGAEIIDEAYLRNRIAGAEKFSENLEKVVGDAAVADNLAVLHLSLGRVVKHPQVAQFRARDGASALVTLPLHPLKHRVRHGRR